MIYEDVFKECPVCGMQFVSVEVEAIPRGYTKDGFPADVEYDATAKCIACENTFYVHGKNMKQLEEAWNELCHEIKSAASNKMLPPAQHDGALNALTELIKYTYKRDCRKCIFCIGQKDSYYIDGRCVLPECPQMLSRHMQEAISARAHELKEK